MSSGLLAACAGGSTPAPETPAPQIFQDDATATPRLRASFEQMLAAVDAGDVNTAMSTTATEGWKLPSYDLDFEGNPIRYASPADARATLESMTVQLRKMRAKLQSVINAFDCQGSSTFAVCVADVVQTVTMPDGTRMPGSGRVTAAARKGNDGWKWTHWHMSLAQAAPPPPQPVVVAPPPPPPLPIAAVNTKDLAWKDVPNMQGVQEAMVWENPTTHESAVFMKVGKATKMPRHYHSVATHGYIVKGGLTVTDEAGKAHEVSQGGWYYEPAKALHTTDVKAGTVVLHIQSGPFDTVMVDDKGNPLPPGSTAPPSADAKPDKAAPATTPTPAKSTTPSAPPGAPAAGKLPAPAAPATGPAMPTPAAGAPTQPASVKK